MNAPSIEDLNRILSGKYEVLRELGRSRSAVVYQVLNVDSNRLEAMKVLDEGFARDEAFVDRFLQVARAPAELSSSSHPNIVTIYDTGKIEGVTYFTMEYLEGESLAGRLEGGGPLPVDEALPHTLEVCRALAYAHARGMTHGNIKPENIMLCREDRVAVTDFGMGRAALSAPHDTRPEQAEGKTVDGRSDVYALGKVLFHMVVGQAYKASVEPQSLNAEIPPWLNSVILKALAKDPGARFESAEAFAKALEEQEVVEAGEGAKDSDETVIRRLERNISGVRGSKWLKPVSIGVGASLVSMALITAVIWGIVSWQREAQQAGLAEQQRAAVTREAQEETRRVQIARKLSEGISALGREAYREAIVAFEDVVKLDPMHTKALRLLEEAQERGQARRVKIVQHLGEGKLALDRADYRAAIVALDAVVALAPEHQEALRLLKGAQERARRVEIVQQLGEGKLGLNRGDYKGAIAAFTAVLESEPEHDQASRLLKKALKHKEAAELGMVYIAPAEFKMGSNEHRSGKPIHTVYVDGFWIDGYEVTVAQFRRFRPDYNPNAYSSCDTCPVTDVSWFDAKAYCKSLGNRLPTEAEWEKACRGSEGYRYSWGNGLDQSKGRFDFDRDDGAVQVGSYPPNGYGVYDMSGNVWEWVADWYDEHYYSRSASRNPEGPDGGEYRVLRGGLWNKAASDVRCTSRHGSIQVAQVDDIGFRCAR